MKRIAFLLFIGLAGCPGFGSQRLGNGLIDRVPECPTYEEHISLIMDAYCVACHGEVSIDEDLPYQFDRYAGPTGVFENAGAIQKACESTTEPMPPSGMPPLDAVELDTLVLWIEQGKAETAADVEGCR